MKRENDTRTVLRRRASGPLFFVGLLLGLNGHLFGFWDIEHFLFLPAKVAEGQWWRLITFPFVHVSWVHLLLDASAFVVLYTAMAPAGTCQRLAAVLLCGLSSLGAAWVLSPEIHDIGLCGLSGIDHGLMAVVTLTMAANRSTRWSGLWGFALLLAKVVYETMAGDALFSNLYLGMWGIPLEACHLGGVLGGLMAWVLFTPGFGFRTGKAVLIRRWARIPPGSGLFPWPGKEPCRPG